MYIHSVAKKGFLGKDVFNTYITLSTIAKKLSINVRLDGCAASGKSD